MAAMSEETICEVVKSCAYGYTVDELAGHYGMEKNRCRKVCERSCIRDYRNERTLKTGGIY